jgi:curved DNA-binding protein
MAVKFQDYYEILGVARSATQEEIQSAYRKLARKYHPDVNKNKGAEDQFKRVGEAYEVLKSPEKRKRYDTLGENWRSGQDFTPPPGWESFGGQGRKQNFGYDFGGFGSTGFSDFFDMLFGGLGGGFGEFRTEGGRSSDAWSSRGEDQEAEITISLEEAHFGGKKSIALETSQTGHGGRMRRSVKNLEVRIPKGITDGKRLRLAGKGRQGPGGGPPGDLYLRIKIEPHRTFTLKGHDLEMDIPVASWEAALGAKIEVPTLDGLVTISLPAGTQSGQKMRLKGKGLSGKGGKQGDLYAAIRIVVPKRLDPGERKLFEELARTSSFRPRK